jgi:hypothetical protein
MVLRQCHGGWPPQGLTGGKRGKGSVIFDAFQGEVKIRTLTRKKKSLLPKVGG